MKEKMYVNVEGLKCPICGKPINSVEISKVYVRCFNKYKTAYYPEYNCDCAERIGEIIDWNNQLKEQFSEINILNKFAEASNLAFEQALKNVGIITENEGEE